VDFARASTAAPVAAIWARNALLSKARSSGPPAGLRAPPALSLLRAGNVSLTSLAGAKLSAFPSAWASAGAAEVMAGGAVYMGGNLALVPVPGGHGSGQLEHQDRPAGRGRLVLGVLRHDEQVTWRRLTVRSPPASRSTTSNWPSSTRKNSSVCSCTCQT